MSPLTYKQDGFSLIEAMIAAMVVGVGMLGLAKLQSNFFSNSSENRVQIAALHFAHQKLEELRGLATVSEFDSALGSIGSGLQGGSESCESDDLNGICPKGLNVVLNRSWSIEDCANSLSCRKVTLTVSWDDADGNAQIAPLVLAAFLPRGEPIDNGLAIAR